MQTKAKKATTKVATKRTLEPREYRLLRYQPLTFTLKTGRSNDLVIFDEDKEVNRAIRHCPNEKSIFVDEQSDNAVVKNIIFINGFLYTEPTEIITQKFLEMHPSEGNIFELIDDAADAKEMIDYEETILDIKQAIRQKAKEENGEETLRVIVSVIISSPTLAANMSVAELKNTLYEAVDSNPDRFIDDSGDVTIFDDSDITRKAVAQQAFVSGVLSVSADSRRIIWSDNKATICQIPTGKNYLNYFANFLETEEGMDVMREIDKR
jgi:hypothetical protein